MKKIFISMTVSAFCLLLPATAPAQGDVRSATGMPIPIGQPVIWGQVEIRGLDPNAQRPTVVVRLIFNGAQIGRSETNDKGFYYFLERARDGAELAVSVAGTDVGRIVITSAGGERYDMTVNWNENFRTDRQPGVVSVKDAYMGRTASTRKLFDSATQAARTNQTDEAIKILEALLKEDEKDFVAWTELGTRRFEKSDHKRAETAYLRAISLDPDFTPALLNLGKLYIVTKQFDDAIARLDRATQLEPGSADAFHYLGEALLQNRQGSRAVVALNEAMRLAPVEKAELHLRLATLYNAAGLRDRAAAEYKLFLDKVPDYAHKADLLKYISENSPN